MNSASGELSDVPVPDNVHLARFNRQVRWQVDPA